MNTGNSAREISSIFEREQQQQIIMDSINRQHIKDEKTKVVAAEATIEQLDLLKQEIDENRKQSNKSMKIAIIGLAVGSATLIVTILSLVLQIIR